MFTLPATCGHASFYDCRKDAAAADRGACAEASGQIEEGAGRSGRGAGQSTGRRAVWRRRQWQGGSRRRWQKKEREKVAAEARQRQCWCDHLLSTHVSHARAEQCKFRTAAAVTKAIVVQTSPACRTRAVLVDSDTGGTQGSMLCHLQTTRPRLLAAVGGRLPTRPCARQTSAGSIMARNSLSRLSDRMPAPEMLWLFEGQPPCVDGGDMQPMLDAVWTLQYQIPGAICGFAGAVVTANRLPGALPRAPQLSCTPCWPWISAVTCSTCSLQRCRAGNHSAGFTHAVHLRFAQLQGMATFSAHDRLQQTLEREAHPLCDSVLEVGFEVRRGPDDDLPNNWSPTLPSLMPAPECRAAPCETWKLFSEKAPIGRKGKSCFWCLQPRMRLANFHSNRSCTSLRSSPNCAAPCRSPSAPLVAGTCAR